MTVFEMQTRILPGTALPTNPEVSDDRFGPLAVAVFGRLVREHDVQLAIFFSVLENGFPHVGCSDFSPAESTGFLS